MTIKDRDNYFAMMVFHDKMLEWYNNQDSELNGKDKSKLKIILDNIIALMVQYRKNQGQVAFDNLVDEARKYHFYIVQDNITENVTDTFEIDIIRAAVKNISENATECVFCDKKDYKKCDWFALKNFTNSAKCNNCKAECPYKIKMEI